MLPIIAGSSGNTVPSKGCDGRMELPMQCLGRFEWYVQWVRVLDDDV
jgi:hypothetical protein